MMNQFTGMMLG